MAREEKLVEIGKALEELNGRYWMLGNGDDTMTDC